MSLDKGFERNHYHNTIITPERTDYSNSLESESESRSVLYLFASPGDLPNAGMEPRSPALQADSLLSDPPAKPTHLLILGYCLFFVSFFWSVLFHKFHGIIDIRNNIIYN